MSPKPFICSPVLYLLMALVLVYASPAVTLAQSSDSGTWVHYGGSERGLQYSSLSRINKENVQDLEVAWTYRTGELGEGALSGYAFQTNPILVENKLYVSTGSAIVIALDPASGRELWRYDPKLDRSRGTSEVANRGVSSWIDPDRKPGDACRHRIFIGTLDARMISLDGETGEPCADFGEDGAIRLDKDVRLIVSKSVNYAITSPPVIVGDTLVTGSAIGDNAAVEMEFGIVRGIDARSGEIRWKWDPIPRNQAEPEKVGWKAGEAAKTGAANAWAPLAADSELNLVYVPTGSASPDFYGGEREGDNKHANSLVALNASTGEVVWAQQLVHHDVWDYDIPAQPTLANLERDGKLIPAVIQATKMGLIFTFNRATGEPIFEIEERKVPQGGVAGEHLSPTQPFPVAPPPIVSHAAVTEEDAFGLLLFDEWQCEDQISQYRSEGIYTPPSLEGTIEFPSYAGGVNWGGMAFNPKTQSVVVNANSVAAVVALIERKNLIPMAESGEYEGSEFARQSGTPYGMRREVMLSFLGVPCSKPPWGTLSSVDMTNGTIQWQVPLGTIEDVAPVFVPKLELGVPGLGGPIVTGTGVIFIGATTDNYLRAIDDSNGKELWRGRLPAGGQATPMTYYLEETGKQYVVMAAGGHPKVGTTPGDYVVAFAL
jgi:quinoprotein glucose dehydrogenase